MLLDRKLEVALDEVVQMRRQKTELLMHQVRAGGCMGEGQGRRGGGGGKQGGKESGARGWRLQGGKGMRTYTCLPSPLLPLSPLTHTNTLSPYLPPPQENLSKDLRDHLANESTRADRAEVALAEERAATARLVGRMDELQQRLNGAMAELQALQAALEEKIGQVL